MYVMVDNKLGGRTDSRYAGQRRLDRVCRLFEYHHKVCTDEASECAPRKVRRSKKPQNFWGFVSVRGEMVKYGTFM